MKKTNSIIEEALIEASQLEEAVKEVGKEVLASAMKQEIDDFIKSSLTEEEEVESPEMDSMGNGSPEEMNEPEMGNDDLPKIPEQPEMGNDDLPEMGDDDLPEIPEQPEMDDDEVMDMTQASDEEVIKVFKSMGPDDSIEVTKTDKGVHLKDGDKEYILQMEGIEEMTDEELDEYLDEEIYEEEDEFEIEMEEDNDDTDEEFESWMEDVLSNDDDDEVMYEIELDESDEELIDEDKDEDDDEEEIDEASRTFGFGSKDGSRGLRKAISPNRNYSYKNGVKTESINKELKEKLSLVESELKEYKSKNNEYKKALTSLKEKMSDMAIYYTNLSYTNKLFTEHTTTKKEKLDILRRFDGVKTINESKSLFSTISDELSNKKTITNLGDLSESVDKALTSSSSKLTESVVYEDPKIKQIKDLMGKITPFKK